MTVCIDNREAIMQNDFWCRYIYSDDGNILDYLDSGGYQEKYNYIDKNKIYCEWSTGHYVSYGNYPFSGHNTWCEDGWSLETLGDDGETISIEYSDNQFNIADVGK